jgi:predicted nucleic acid-binding Zn ribbon protein
MPRRSRNYTYAGMIVWFGIVVLNVLVMAVVAGWRM